MLDKLNGVGKLPELFLDWRRPHPLLPTRSSKKRLALRSGAPIGCEHADPNSRLLAPTANGLLVEGAYDLGDEDFVGLRVGIRLSQENKGRVANAEKGPAGVVRITTPEPHMLRTGDQVTVFGVEGTVEANGDRHVRVISDHIFDLRRMNFVNQHTANMGEWFLRDSFEETLRVNGDPPPTNWSHNLVLGRPAIYEVRALLAWTGSPSVISTARSSVKVP